MSVLSTEKCTGKKAEAMAKKNNLVASVKEVAADPIDTTNPDTEEENQATNRVGTSLPKIRRMLER